MGGGVWGGSDFTDWSSGRVSLLRGFVPQLAGMNEALRKARWVGDRRIRVFVGGLERPDIEGWVGVLAGMGSPGLMCMGGGGGEKFRVLGVGAGESRVPQPSRDVVVVPGVSSKWAGRELDKLVNRGVSVVEVCGGRWGSRHV